MSGVDSRLNSGRGPRLSVLKRQATSRLLKLVRLILIERRVSSAAEIGAVCAPLSVFRTRLPGQRHHRRMHQTHEYGRKDYQKWSAHFFCLTCRAQKTSGTENVNTLFRRISEMMISLFFGFNVTPKGFLSVVLGPIGIFHFGGTSPLSS